MNKKQIKKRYEKLLNDVKNDDFYDIDLTEGVNCYQCNCGHITKTKDIDAGVTPFMHSCEKCGKLARSTFYNDIRPNQEPTEEWYRPTLEQLYKMSDGMIDHVLQGGLNVRKLSTHKDK